MKNILLTLTTAALVVSLAPSAEAGHNEKYRVRSLQEIAHDLEEATRYVHRNLEHRYGSRHYRDSRSLRDSYELAGRARHFHQEVERNRRDPWHTLKDYEVLTASYNRAHNNLRYMRVSDNIYQDFRRVGSLMAELESHYRRASYRTRPGQRYEGRHDRRPTYHGHRNGDYGVRIQLPRIEIQWDWRH